MPTHPMDLIDWVSLAANRHTKPLTPDNCLQNAETKGLEPLSWRFRSKGPFSFRLGLEKCEKHEYHDKCELHGGGYDIQPERRDDSFNRARNDASRKGNWYGEGRSMQTAWEQECLWSDPSG